MSKAVSKINTHTVGGSINMLCNNHVNSSLEIAMAQQFSAY